MQILEPNSDELSISLAVLVKFFKCYYRAILSIGLAGLVCAIVVTYLFGNYTATLILQNVAGNDLARLKYMQLKLPKLEQENQINHKDNEGAYLSSERFWKKNFNPILLLGKSDVKDLVDSSSLKISGSIIASFQFTAMVPSEALSKSLVVAMTKSFVNGGAYFELQELISQYEMKVIKDKARFIKEINSEEVELVYVQRRIQNLIALKNQYPSVAAVPLQIVDIKESGAKYLPISTQIVATTTDANYLKESLVRKREKLKQLTIYEQFIEKAKPLIKYDREDDNLVGRLLELINQIEKNTQEDSHKITLQDIRSDLMIIKANQSLGYRQESIVIVSPPPYLENTAIGFLASLFLGFLLVLGHALVKQYKSNINTLSKVNAVSN
jgi:hypothetical protein